MYKLCPNLMNTIIIFKLIFCNSIVNFFVNFFTLIIIDNIYKIIHRICPNKYFLSYVIIILKQNFHKPKQKWRDIFSIYKKNNICDNVAF